MKKTSFLIGLFFLHTLCLSQVISTTGLQISTSSGLFVNCDSIYNNSGNTFTNEGNLSVASLINGGTIQGSGNYNISYIFSNSGTFTPNNSTVHFNGSISQDIPGLLYYNLFTSGSSTKSLAGNVSLLNELSIGANSTLALGSNNILLKSDSTYTARVSSVPATASVTYGTGRFISERYVKGRRKYRLFTSPVTSSPNATLTGGEESLSIWGNWQNSGNNSTANAGTFITGGIAADGFDTQVSNASLFTYNSSTRSFSAFTSSNGKNTKYTPLKAGIPYYMFMWGDRTNSPIAATPNKTTITSTGKILTGDQTYNTGSTIPLSNTTGGFTLIGNPFASPIDWSTVSRTNLADTYWGWDPNLNSTGGYVTVSTTGTVTLVSPFSGSVGLNQYIQTGQAFFVKTTASSPVLVIKESDKIGNFNANAFRTEANDIPLIAVNLFHDEENTKTLMDGTLAVFDDSFSTQVNDEDAEKIHRAGEEISIKKSNHLLSIDAGKMPSAGDTIYLNTSSLSKSKYRLQVFSKYLEQFPIGAWLEDNYLKTSRLIAYTDTNHILFTINKNVAATSDVNRFRIVFGTSSYNVVNSPVAELKVDIRIVTNQVQSNAIQFQLINCPSGYYQLQLFNAAGQLVSGQQTSYGGGNANSSIKIPLNLAAGIYYLRCSNNEISLSKQFLIK